MIIGILKILLTCLLIVTLCSCSAKSKEELFASGKAEVKKGNPNGAIVFFKNALENDPKYFEARHQLAKAYLAAGKPELSAKEFARLIKDDVTSSGAQLELAKAYILGNKPDQALEEADAHIKKHGTTSESYELQGLALAAKGNLDAAEAALRKALSLEPSRNTAKLALANIFQFTGKKEKEIEGKRLIKEVIAAEPKNVKAFFMLAVLESVAGDNNAALSIYRTIYEIDSSNYAALYKSGFLSIVKGDTAQADQAADILIKNFPKKSEGIRLKGINNYHRKNYADAIIELQQSIKIQPAPEAFYYLGLCYYSTGELELALVEFRKTLARSPFAGSAKLLTVMTLLRQKRFNDAAAEIKPFLAANPGNALAHNLMGSVLIGQGLHDEGMAEFNKAIQLDHKIIDAHLNKGKIHLFRGNLKDAEGDFITALQQSPELLNTRLVLASLYAREKNSNKALAMLEKGLSGSKDDAIIYNYLAAVMFSQARQEDGLKYLLASKKADPAYLTASFNIATYYSAIKNYDKAFDEYAEILQKSPHNAKTLISVATLKELKGDDKEALSYYKKALKTKDPASYLAMAYYYLRKGDAKKALSFLDDGISTVARNVEAMEMKRQILISEARFSEAVKVCDDMEEVDQQLGMHKKIETYLSKKDFSKAKEQALRYITVNPSSANGYIDLATVYEIAGEFDKAIIEIKKSIKIDRNSVAALQKLSTLYALKKDYKAAIELNKEVLQKNPDFIPALFSQGKLQEDMGNKSGAMTSYQEVLARSESYLPALNNLAYLNVDGNGNAQEGLRLAFLASRLSPSSPEIMDTLGYALMKNGRRDESRQVLEKAYKLLPNNPTVTYHLALVYLESGARQNGIALLQKALTMGDFPEAAIARRLIK